MLHCCFLRLPSWLMIVIISLWGSRQRHFSSSIGGGLPAWLLKIVNGRWSDLQMNTWHCLWNLVGWEKDVFLKRMLFYIQIPFPCASRTEANLFSFHVNVIREGRNVHIVKWMVSLIMGHTKRRRFPWDLSNFTSCSGGARHFLDTRRSSANGTRCDKCVIPQTISSN